MFTLTDLFSLLMPGYGALIGYLLGKHFGHTWAIVGVVIGLIIGWLYRGIPYRLVNRQMHRELAPLSIDELQARLCDLECITPNFILLELKCRGVNIDEFLPVVLALLESDRSDRRTTGYAAFLSAFSQYSALLPKYNPFNETAECQAKVAVLREALTEHPSPLPPPTDN